MHPWNLGTLIGYLLFAPFFAAVLISWLVKAITPPPGLSRKNCHAERVKSDSERQEQDQHHVEPAEHRSLEFLMEKELESAQSPTGTKDLTG
jgi:hypothetical protein